MHLVVLRNDLDKQNEALARVSDVRILVLLPTTLVQFLRRVVCAEEADLVQNLRHFCMLYRSLFAFVSGLYPL